MKLVENNNYRRKRLPAINFLRTAKAKGLETTDFSEAVY